MKKRPFLMALLSLGAIFLFFLVLITAVSFFWGRPSGLSLKERIGVVEVVGVIADGRKISEQLVDFREDDSIRAVVLRVNSPGGGVAPSQEICEEVVKLTEAKPVVVSMGSVAASGGYYIAAPATRIMANPGSITGSIGVIMEFTNVQELLNKIGLQPEVVKSGEHKDLGSPFRPMSPSDRKILQDMIDDVHEQFIRQVAASRHLPEDEVRGFADGRIFSGQQAQRIGLVDDLGNFQDAVAAAAKLAGIEGTPRLVYPSRQRLGLLEHLIQNSVSRIRRELRQQLPDGLHYLWQENF